MVMECLFPCQALGNPDKQRTVDQYGHRYAFRFGNRRDVVMHCIVLEIEESHSFPHSTGLLGSSGHGSLIYSWSCL